MQLRQGLVILAVVVMIVIYWVLINQSDIPKEETSKQNIPPPNLQVLQGNGDSFFPKADPLEEADSIKEETFVESP